MEKIPTAEELIRLQFCKGEFEEIMECLNASIEPSIVRAMIEFAKLHVEAALKEASKKSKNKEGQITDHKLTNSILNSYPLSNIK